ncbi:hypothetical protein BJ508DRAFT_334940 [Ascobolus immersus RN42]|uniref:Uncharacterized protein n=1 Tax=Ascobolus immersus RN42 TaxID=1160509 RepID=A0A3N4HG66_ASCIM|nr:hypothetical protein BJ508DRAFT_334940 [Ascobolus immersus RN42]
MREIGNDTKNSNGTYPDQLGEEMTNLEQTFRKMKAANWQRFLYHQSPVYFKKYLPKYHYDNCMNMVEAMRLSTRKVLDEYEAEEVGERFFQFVEYYEKEIYRYDIDRVTACLPTIHQLRHVHEAILNWGPTFSYAQWTVERINGMITSAVKSRKQPDENIATILEVDIHSSLLPFVIPGMQTVMAKDAFADADGRLIIHKIFRHMVQTGQTVLADDDDSDASPEPEFAELPDRPSTRRKRPDPAKVRPEIIESVINSDPNVDEFAVTREQLEEEFGMVITDDDIRRALRRIGDVMLVDRVKYKKKSDPILDAAAYTELRKYVKEYFDDLRGDKFDFLFEWEAEPYNEEYDMASPHSHIVRPTGRPLVNLQHHPAVKFTKWKNVRFENVTKMEGFTIDTRSVRISGSQYTRANRTRQACFFEFSTDTTLRTGAQTAGNLSERASSSRSDHPREFAEALYFLTVDFDWDLVTDLPEGILKENMPRSLFLCYSRPLSTRNNDSLTVLNRMPLPAGTRRGAAAWRPRRYKASRWLDVDDFVDIIGLLRCRGDEYVCWKDASWDPIIREQLHPLSWKFRPEPGQHPAGQGGNADRSHEQARRDAEKENDPSTEDIMRSWTPPSDNLTRAPRQSSEYQPDSDKDAEYDPDEQMGRRGRNQSGRSRGTQQTEIKEEEKYQPSPAPIGVSLTPAMEVGASHTLATAARVTAAPVTEAGASCAPAKEAGARATPTMEVGASCAPATHGRASSTPGTVA